jgi:hypothetical protein
MQLSKSPIFVIFCKVNPETVIPQKWFKKICKWPKKYSCAMGHHILYLEPPGKTAKNVLETV